MTFTCNQCEQEFEAPAYVETGGEYGGTPHKEPASPCCEDSFTENN